MQQLFSMDEIKIWFLFIEKSELLNKKCWLEEKMF